MTVIIPFSPIGGGYKKSLEPRLQPELEQAQVLEGWRN